MDNGAHLLDRIAELREENEHLRLAARSFGELAERLMQELEAERRRAVQMKTDGRASRRPRRAQHQPVA
jgi:hypothetical protein